VRHAVYFAPAVESRWWQFGAAWLGRDDRSAEPAVATACASVPADERSAWTATPRRYGFHATLKAPMRLADGVSEADLIGRVQDLARTLSSVRLSPLALAARDGFVALVPSSIQVRQAVAAIEAACVQALDDLRAPLSANELSARRSAGLDAEANAMLVRWGYPWVLQRFRMHITLTGLLTAPQRERVIAALTPQIAALDDAEPLSLDRLCVFVEPAPGQALLRRAEALLGG
jgi:hypothetical protein